MPDLTIEIMEQCSSINEMENIQVGNHTVTKDIFNDVTCTCKAFKYNSKRTCKHIAYARMNKLFNECTYHEMVDGPPKVKGVCPKCGKDTEYVRVGV